MLAASHTLYAASFFLILKESTQMQEQEYLITLLGKDNRKTLRLGYRNGLLVALHIPETESYDAMALCWLCSWLRSQVTEDELNTNCGDVTNVVKFRVAKVEANLEFETFWNAYDYKVGNKARAQKLWGNISKDDKIRCFIGVRSYNYWLSLRTNTEKLYPETFLHQRRWENEYKI